MDKHFPAVFRCFRLFSAVFSCFLMFSAFFSCFLLFPAVFSCFQLFSAVFSCFPLFSAVSCCFQLFSAVFSLHFAVFGCFQLFPAVFSCFFLYILLFSAVFNSSILEILPLFPAILPYFITFCCSLFFLPPHLDAFLCFLPSLLVSAILLFFCLSSLIFRFFYSSVFNIVKFSILSSYLISLPHARGRSAAATPPQEMRPPTRSSPGQPKGHFYYVRRKSCSASHSDARGSNDINK